MADGTLGIMPIMIEVNELGPAPEPLPPYEYRRWDSWALPQGEIAEWRRQRQLQDEYDARIAVYRPRLEIRSRLADWAAEYGIELIEIPGRLELNESSNLRPNPLDEYNDLSDVPDIQIPKTVRYDDFIIGPFFPVVIKFWKGKSGLHKYKIDDSETFKKFQNWMEQFGDKEEWVCQEYIETPSDSYSSYRVLVTCTGEIVASQIMYGPEKTDNMLVDKSQEKNATDDPKWLLTDFTSEFCLTPLVIHSNRLLAKTYKKYGGPGRIASLAPGAGLERNEYVQELIGGRIVLDPIARSHSISKRERDILKAHKLDPIAPKLPRKLHAVSSEVARRLCWDGEKRIKELWLGIDFLQNTRDRRMLLVEANRRPSLAAIRDLNGGVDKLSDVGALTWLTRRVIVDIAQEANLERRGV